MTRIAIGSASGKRMHAAGLRAVNAHVKLQQSAARFVDGLFFDEETTKPGDKVISDVEDPALDVGRSKPRASTAG